MNWRNDDSVDVGFLRYPEFGMLRCSTVARSLANDEPHGVTKVRWCAGRIVPVAWCHSQMRYVFTNGPVTRGR